MRKFFRETFLIFMRSIRRTLRNPVWILIGLMQPVLYLVLFAPLLNGLSIPGFSQGNALNGFVPGLLVMSAMFSAGFAGFGVLPDLQSGVIERLRVTPASRLAILLGMLLHDMLTFLIQCALLVIVATLMGLRADPLGLILLFALLALVGLMAACVSYAFALIFKDQSTLAAISNVLLLPLMLLSGVLLPLILAPQFMQSLARLNPFAHAVEAARALVNGTLGDSAIVLAFVIVGGLASLAILWATRIFRQVTA